MGAPVWRVYYLHGERYLARAENVPSGVSSFEYSPGQNRKRSREEVKRLQTLACLRREVAGLRRELRVARGKREG